MTLFGTGTSKGEFKVLMAERGVAHHGKVIKSAV